MVIGLSGSKKKKKIDHIIIPLLKINTLMYQIR